MNGGAVIDDRSPVMLPICFKKDDHPSFLASGLCLMVIIESSEKLEIYLVLKICL